MSQPSPGYSLNPLQRSWEAAKRQLAIVRQQLTAAYARRRMMRRLFGDPAEPTRDARLFFLMLADMAGMGATDIAESDREEAARGANRALVNKLIVLWEGDDETLMNLRAMERELTKEDDDE